MNLIVALLNVALRLVELSARIALELIGLGLKLLGVLIAAAANGNSSERKTGRHQPPRRHSSGGKGKWSKHSNRRR